MRGSIGQILTASTQSKCEILSAELFLKFVADKKFKKNIVDRISPPELFDIAKKSKISSQLKDYELFHWAEIVCSKEKLKVFYIDEKNKASLKINNKLILNSSNIKGLPIGSITDNFKRN